MPERSRRSAVSVKGVDAIVLCGHKENVVLAFARDIDVGNVERLRVDVAVHFKGEQPAELRGVDVCRRQNSLVQIRTGARVVELGGQQLWWSWGGKSSYSREIGAENRTAEIRFRVICCSGCRSCNSRSRLRISFANGQV